MTDITIELELNSTSYTVKMRNAERTLNRFSKALGLADRQMRKVDRGFTGFLPKLRDFALVGAVATHTIHGINSAFFAWQKTMLDTAGEFERMMVLMRGMSNEIDPLRKELDAINNFEFVVNLSKNAPFEIKVLNDAFVKMKSVGIDPTTGALQSLTDAVAAFGGDSQIFHRASIAIQQMAGKGVISMEELRQQLGEAVPRAIELMARSMGKSYKELVDEISTGQVEAKGALDRMLNEFNLEFGGAASRMMQTWSGMTQRLTTEWQLFQAEIAKTGYMEEAKALVNDLINTLNSSQGQYIAEQIGIALKNFLTIVRDGTQWILDHRESVVRWVKALGTLAVALGIRRVIMGVVTSLAAMRTATSGLTTVLQGATLRFGALIGGIASGTGILAGIRLAFLGVGRAILSALGPIGLVTAALYTLYDLYRDTASAAADAAKEMNRTKGRSVTVEGLDSVKIRYKELETEHDALTARVKAAQDKLNDPKTFKFSSNVRNELKEATEALREWMIDNKAEFDEMASAMAYGMAEMRNRETDQAMADIRRSSDQMLQGLRSAQANALAYTQKHRDDLYKGDKAYFEKRAEILRAYNALQKKLVQDQIDSLETKLGQNILNSTRNAINAQIAFLRDKLRELGEELDNSLQLNSGLNIEGDGTNYTSAYGKLVGKLERRLEGLKEANADPGASGYLARVAMELRQLGLEGDDAIEKSNRVMGLAREIVGQEATKKFIASTAKMREEIARLDAQLNDGSKKAETWMQRFLSGQFGDVRYLAPGQVEEIKELINTIEDKEFELFDKKALEEADKEMREGMEEFSTFTYELNEDLDKANAALVWGEVNRRRAALDIIIKDRLEMARSVGRAGEVERQNAIAAAQQLGEKMVKVFERQNDPIQSLADKWSDLATNMKEATADWLDDASRRLTDFVLTGKFGFKDFAASIIEDLIRIQIQEKMSQIMAGAASGGAGGGIGGALFSGIASIFGFAKGGVMTKDGPVPIQRYATGGIASSAQLAMFGEGSMPEAFVPLPDGRSIPVKMEGGGGGQQQAPNVSVNIINQSGTPMKAEQGGVRFDGKQAILDVVMEAAAKPGPFRESLRNVKR